MTIMKKRKRLSKSKVKQQSQRVRFALALPLRLKEVSEQLVTLDEVLGQLFADENFVTLLQAESMTSVPNRYQAFFEEVSRGNEIRK
jgi:hypothetical protein